MAADVNSPKEIVSYVAHLCEVKDQCSTSKILALAFLGGAYIAFGGLLALSVGGAINALPGANLPLAKLFMGAVFPIGLILVALAGAELFTGNTAYFIPGVLSGQVPFKALVRNWVLVYLGNFVGSLFVVYFLVIQTGVLSKAPLKDFAVSVATHKMDASFFTVVCKGIGCNWMVALAMWLCYSAKQTSGKILGIWFPIMAFVALGYEHCVANMFFIPTGMALGMKATWGEFVVHNLIPATIGNILGGSVLVGGIYWFAYGEKKAPAITVSEVLEEKPLAGSSK